MLLLMKESNKTVALNASCQLLNSSLHKVNCEEYFVVICRPSCTTDGKSTQEVAIPRFKRLENRSKISIPETLSLWTKKPIVTKHIKHINKQISKTRLKSKMNSVASGDTYCPFFC